jgi:hypothetical protein
MAFSEALPPRPPIDVPLVDLTTGCLTPPWYRYFAALQAWMERAAAAI